MTKSVKPKNEIAELVDIAPNTLSTVMENKNDVLHKFERNKRIIGMKFSVYHDIEVDRNKIFIKNKNGSCWWYTFRVFKRNWKTTLKRFKRQILISNHFTKL